MTALYLFISTFVLVFALGFQSLNVNGGHYWLAFFTSFAIGTANLVLYKLAPSADFVEMAAFLLGGPFGIVASMWAHSRVVRPKRDDGNSASSTPGRKRPAAGAFADEPLYGPLDARRRVTAIRAPGAPASKPRTPR